MLSLKHLFKYPCDPKLLNIYKVDLNKTGESVEYSLKDFKYKCAPFPLKDSKIAVFPILHSSLNLNDY